jgi:hypothetical protein
MTIQYNVLTIENQKAINERAKSRKDGVYEFRGIVFRVRDHHATHFATQGQVLEQYGHFNAMVGKYDSTKYDHREVAKKLLKTIKD